MTHSYVTAAASGGSEGGDQSGGGPSELDHGDGSESGSSSVGHNSSERDVVSLVYAATNFRDLHDGIFHGLKGWFDEVVEYTEVFAPYQQLYSENEGVRVSIHT